MILAAHDGCIVANVAGLIEYRAATGVEQWMIFHHFQRGFDRLGPGAARLEHPGARSKCGFETGPRLRFFLGRKIRARRVPRTAMNGDNPLRLLADIRNFGSTLCTRWLRYDEPDCDEHRG